MPIKAKARARGLMGVACIVALRAAGPQRSAIPGGCTQNTLKSFEGSIEVVENRFINLLVVVREVALAAPAAGVG